MAIVMRWDCRRAGRTRLGFGIFGVKRFVRHPHQNGANEIGYPNGESAMSKPKLKMMKHIWICSCPLAIGAGHSAKEAYKRWNDNWVAKSVFLPG